jgi:hypothetical protein
MTKLLSLFMKYVGYRLEDKVAGVVAPIGPYVKSLTLGIACIAASVVCFTVTLLFLATSLFTALASRSEWAMAALWTGLAVAVLGGIITALGLSFLKTPFQSASS